MKKTGLLIGGMALAMLCGCATNQLNTKLEENNSMTNVLPAPNFKGSMPLMEAFNKRCSNRDFNADGKLTKQELSELLWCANGFNRENMRTAPSAVNAQAITIYVFDAEGVWEYMPKDNKLSPIADGDHRADTGMQPFVKDAAVNLVYVYDKDKWPMAGGTDGKFAAVDAAFCAENVYLYCASKSLKTVVRGSFDQAKLLNILKLSSDKMVVGLVQSVGR